LRPTTTTWAVVGINPNDAEEYPDDSFAAMRERVADGTVAYDAYLRDETAEVATAYDAVCTPDPFLFGREDGAWRLRYHGRLDDALNPTTSRRSATFVTRSTPSSRASRSISQIGPPAAARSSGRTRSDSEVIHPPPR